ncbi:hypothetical protein CsSME_00011409 [Camellia sinensis var. sinensis]
MGVPAFFTDQSELSCANAKQVLRSAGLHITQPVTPNPFRSPVRNNGPSSNLPLYSNEAASEEGFEYADVKIAVAKDLGSIARLRLHYLDKSLTSLYLDSTSNKGQVYIEFGFELVI